MFQTDLIDGEREILAVVKAVREHFDIVRNELRLLGELLFEEVNGLVNRSIEKPADYAEGEHVAGLEDGLIVEAAVLERLFGERCERYRHNLHRFRDIEFGKRIVGLVLRFLKVGLSESVGIDDEDSMLVEELLLHADFECGRVHRYNYIGLVAGRVNTLT